MVLVWNRGSRCMCGTEDHGACVEQRIMVHVVSPVA